MSEDILERAKKADIDLMAITDWGQLRDLFGELIAEVEAKNDKIAQDAITIQMHHGNVLTLQKEVERLRSLNESLMENGNDLRTRCQKAEARIKELQDLLDKPPEEADWVADYHLLQSALDGPIIDAARKWHAAYRKAQNSNLMRAKEVERLRSLEKCVSPVIDRQGKTNAALFGQLDVISAYLDTEMAEWKNGDQIAEIAIKFMDRQKQNLNDANSQIATKDARIKELEALNELNHKNMRSWLDTTTDKEFLDKLSSEIGFKDAYIKRLEAAFLEQFVQGILAPREMAELMAREALERIRNGE